jgi:hypothetical protein
MSRILCFSALLFLCAVISAEEILVIKQDYNIVETTTKGGAKAKDIRQILYISSDFICIDELGGKDGDKIIESIMLDLKNKQIINVDHENKKKVTESFEDRRKRIEQRKKIAQQDIDNHDPGRRRDDLIGLYRALLDDKRRFSFAQDPGEAKVVAGVKCNPLKIVAEDVKDYVPLQAQLHPEVPLTYDNAEVLYLLQIIGKRMADFMREHKDKFKYVPMELHLDLAAGGTLDTKVVSVEKLEKAKLSPRALGDAFVIPPYVEVQKRRPPTPKRDEKDKPD